MSIVSDDVTLDLESLLGGTGTYLPDRVWLLYSSSGQVYSCIEVDSVVGVACFTSKDRADMEISMMVTDHVIESQEFKFDAARDLAKRLPMPVVALIFMDDEPKIHYVK